MCVVCSVSYKIIQQEAEWIFQQLDVATAKILDEFIPNKLI